MQQKPLLHSIGIVTSLFSVGSGIFAACGDTRAQFQAQLETGRPGLEAKSEKPKPDLNEGTPLTQNATNPGPQTTAQGLRHSTGDEGHVVGMGTRAGATAQGNTALLSEPNQTGTASQKSTIAGCSKSDYASNSGASDSVKSGPSNRAKADCDQ